MRQVHLLDPEFERRHIGGHQSARAAHQVDLAAADCRAAVREYALERALVVARQVVAQGAAHESLRRKPEHLCQIGVAEEDHAVRGQRHRAFPHGLDQQAIDAVGAAQGIDLLAARAADHQRVHLAVANRVQQLLGFGQPQAHLRQFRACVGA